MSLALSLTENNVYKALGDFLTGVLPAGVPVRVAQINRVGAPPQGDYVLMNAVGKKRLGTNTDEWADALFTGSIAGNVLTITAVQFGAINVGSPVFGVDVAPGTTVTALGTGTGGIGTYSVNTSQTVASQAIAAGVRMAGMTAQAELQIDVHGPSSGDNATRIALAFHDQYAVDAFKASGFAVAPLYVDDPIQLPYVNDSQQIEQRWIVRAHIQINPIVTIPQQFAGALSVTTVEVDQAGSLGAFLVGVTPVQLGLAP